MAFPNRFLLRALLALVAQAGAILAAIPNASCNSQNQALVCQYVDLSHVELVSDHLSKMATEHTNFGVAFYSSELNGFPEDFFQNYNITTFAHVAERRVLTEFPITKLLMALRSKVTHLYLVASAVHTTDLEQLKRLPFRESLRFLDLRYNALGAIEANTFAEFPLLEELNLLGNNITRLTQNSFGGLGHLRKLTLSHNAVADIEEEAFKDLHSLIQLDLSQSDLFTLPKNTFVNLENLQSLDLSLNKLAFLEKGVFGEKDLPKLSEIKLGSNPFFCQCDLQWLKLWLTEKGLLTSSGAACINERLALKKFAVVDFCPDLHVDDDELVAEEIFSSDKKQGRKVEDEEEEDTEAEEDEDEEEEVEEDIEAEDEEEEDINAEYDDDDWNFKEEL